MRASCWVMVLPPCPRVPDFALATTAAPMRTRSTPLCSKKRWSSTDTTASRTLRAILLERHLDALFLEDREDGLVGLVEERGRLRHVAHRRQRAPIRHRLPDVPGEPQGARHRDPGQQRDRREAPGQPARPREQPRPHASGPLPAEPAAESFPNAHHPSSVPEARLSATRPAASLSGGHVAAGLGEPALPSRTPQSRRCSTSRLRPSSLIRLVGRNTRVVRPTCPCVVSTTVLHWRPNRSAGGEKRSAS